jgi:hypothetical protein
MKTAKSRYYRYFGESTWRFMIEFFVGLDMQESANIGTKMIKI